MSFPSELFDQLFTEYRNLNPSVKKIHQLFENTGEELINDHIAFRTLNFPEISIDKLAQPFIENGYKEKGNYCFEEKKLTAKHYELPNIPSAPKIFISQLMVDQLSEQSQKLVNKFYQILKLNLNLDTSLLFGGNFWGIPEYPIYEQLLQESEYAAWFYVFGFRANHFTVNTNYLERFDSLEAVNEFLKNNDYQLNTSGGEIKGTPAQYLEQSSTLADIVPIQFTDKEHLIPACYYEFARRYPLPTGELFNGFIASSADKIFESTNFRDNQ